MTDNPTPIGVTHRGRIVWANENGERDFSPETQRLIRRLSLVFALVVTLLALGFATGIIPAAPWAPAG